MNPTIDLTGTKLGGAYDRAKKSLGDLGYKSPDIKELAPEVEKELVDVPTVITDESARRKIPDLKTKANKLAETGQFTDTSGITRNADGSVAEDPKKKEIADLTSEADAIDDNINGIIKSLIEKTDADTARQIGAIQSQYAVRKNQLEEINAQNEQATGFFLGPSMRYAKSANDVTFTEKRFGLMELARLDALEQSAIAEVKTAEAKQDYDLMEKTIDRAEKIRDEKIAKAKKISEDLDKENEETRKNAIKVSRQSAIASIFKQGITEPADILDYINYTDSGELTGDITLNEIQDVVKIISPTADLAGLNTDYRTYKSMLDAGEIPKGWDYFDFQAASANAKRENEGASESAAMTDEDKRTLVGSGFNEAEIADIPKAVSDFGIDAVLETISDEGKRKALRKIYNIEEQVTLDQIKNTVTQKVAQEGLKETYTDDELIELARDKGFAQLFTGKDGEVEDFLNSDEARKLYVEILAEQYRDAGVLKE